MIPIRTRPVFSDKAVTRMKAMKAKGETNRVIANSLGSTPNSVGSTCTRLGIYRYDQQARGRFALACRVSPETARTIRDEAKKRGMTQQQLLRDLLTNIADDDLFNAVIK